MDPKYNDAHLAILTFLESRYGGNALEQADIETLFRPWAREGRPLLDAALDILVNTLALISTNPDKLVAHLRASIIDAMAEGDHEDGHDA